MVYIHIQMDQNMKVVGKMINNMVMVQKHGQMVIIMKEIINMV